MEPEKTLAAVKHENATLTHALTTHHHHDHAGGNEKLAGLVKGIEVVGGDDRIPAMNKKVIKLVEGSVGVCACCYVMRRV